MLATAVRLSRPYRPILKGTMPRNATPKGTMPGRGKPSNHSKFPSMVREYPVQPPPRAGERAFVEMRRLEEKIVYETDDFLLFDKPAGAALQGVYGTKSRVAWDNILKGLEARVASPRVFVVHRLDKATTGLILLAKTPRHAATLIKQFQSRDVQKVYLAVTTGAREIGSTGIVTQALRVGDTRVERCDPSDPREERDLPCMLAATKWTCLDSTDEYSLLRLEPSTGRKHQLRIHCAESLNSGIVGDFKYAPDVPHRKLFDLPPDAILLHSYSLAFYTWLKTGKRRTVEVNVDPTSTFAAFCTKAGLDLKKIRTLPAPASLEVPPAPVVQ